jgi:TfoX/Sxy family transcriptional regulator of competence genes
MAHDQELADRVREHVEHEPGFTEKKMFGGIAFLINGRMAVGASSKGGLMLRIDPADTESLLRDPRARPFEMRGRELNGWLRIDVDAQIDDAELASWIRRGIDYARSLPPR